MSYWDKILESFSYKTKTGAPDFSNPNDRLLLRMELLKKGWNENAVNELLSRLIEVRSKEQEEYRYGKQWVQQPQVHTRQDYFSRCEDDCTENPHKVGKNIFDYQSTSLFSLFLLNHFTSRSIQLLHPILVIDTISKVLKLFR